MQENRLPVWATVKQSYGWIRHHPRLLAVPMLLLFAAEFVQEIVSARMLPDAWGKVASALLLMVIDGAFCVGLHRTVIIDEIRGGPAFFRWGFELWRYLKTMLIVTLAGMLIAAAIFLGVASVFGGEDLRSAKTILIACIAGLPVLYLLGRLLLTFPAAALGEDQLFRLSWRNSKGNALRLLAVLFLTTLLPSVIGGLLDSSLLASDDQTLTLLTAAGSSAFEVLGTALVTNALSFSYRRLVAKPADADRPSADLP